MEQFHGFQKRKDFLVCIDSDGCVMDTMDIKHIRCFAPCLIEEWALDDYAQEVMYCWNQVNLYSMTRGINRFQALSIVLEQVSRQLRQMEGLEVLAAWIHQDKALSEQSLAEQLECCSSPILKKVLHWSQEVNRRIEQLPEMVVTAFPGAREAIARIHEMADVVVVSSANYEAVEGEWRRLGLTDHVDLVLAQNAGSKAQCIRQLLSCGYDVKRTLMIGDAPGDMDAAKENAICFYPILTTHEAASWKEAAAAVELMRSGAYEGTCQTQKEYAFLQNLRA